MRYAVYYDPINFTIAARDNDDDRILFVPYHTIMQHQKQRKIKSSLSRRDPGELLSSKLVGIFAIVLLAFFFVYVLAFHAILHQNSDVPVPVAVEVPVAVAVPVAAVHENHQQHAAVHDVKKAETAPLPIPKGIRERQVVETKKNAVGAATETLVLKTAEGNIKITLLPDLSKESIDYIRAMVADAGNCSPCNLYRAEKPGILQGVLTNKEIPVPTVKGTCPQGSEGVPNDCPDWDKTCGCHGPVMTKGMVAWAAGATGPDFFISHYEKPALFWGTQHTAWGEIQDEESMKVVNHIIMELPAKHHGGLTFLKKPLHIDIAMKHE